MKFRCCFFLIFLDRSPEIRSGPIIIDAQLAAAAAAAKEGRLMYDGGAVQADDGNLFCYCFIECFSRSIVRVISKMRLSLYLIMVVYVPIALLQAR